ncbi:unnamed protein product [Absidia cylindrospora]
MWLSQRFSAINKQLRKPTKSQSTTLPRKQSTGIATPYSPLKTTTSSTLPHHHLATPPESPNIPGTTPPPLVLSTSKTAAPTTTNSSSNKNARLFPQNIPLEIMVVGAAQVTKSAAIRLGLDDVRPVRSKYKGGHTYQTKFMMDRTLYPLDLVKMDDTNVIDTSKQPSKVHNDFIHFDGAIVCYDTNNRASMDCLPDLLNALLTRRIPMFLVGLKTDLTGQCETDPQLGKKLATLFDIPCRMVDVYSSEGEIQMQSIYSALIQKIVYPPSPPSNVLRRPSSIPQPQRQHLLSQQQQQQYQQRGSVRKRNSNPPPSSLSFQTRKRDSTLGRHASSSSSISSTSSSSSSSSSSPPPFKRCQSRTQQSPRRDLLVLASRNNAPRPISTHDPRSGMLTPPLSPIRPTSICLPLLPSKKQVSVDPCFRDDFDVLPSPASITSTSNGTGLTADAIVKKLILWDYHDQETLTLVFLTFYRKFMTPYQLLQSLIERFEHDYGSDLQPTRLQERIRTILCLWLSHHWGDIYYGRSHQTLHRFLQHLGHNQHLSTMYQLLVPLITRAGPLSDPDSVWGLTDEENDTELNSNTSFYGLWANSPSIATMLCMSSSNQSITGNGSGDSKNQRQHSSTASLDWFKQVNDHHPLSPTNTTNNKHDNNLPTLSSSSSTPYSSFMDASSCYTTSNNIRQKRIHSKRASLLKPTSHLQSSQTFMGNPAVFGGGLVLLETTGRRPFSLVALQSSLRHMSHIRYAMLMDLPVDLLAEQLTWVELTLYRYIKPRDYIRHLWGEQGASEAMMASITHGQFIKGWVVTMILTQNHLCQRVALLDKFVALAYRIYHDHRNYNTLMSLLEGMGHVMRCLKQTHLGLDHEKQQQLLELETLMKSDRNYALYRQDLGKTKDGPSIPYLWVHRQDIVNLAETRRDVTLCGGIHWEKFRFMGEIILHLTHGITLATTTQPNPCVLAFISDTTLLTEEERIGRLVELGEK